MVQRATAIQAAHVEHMRPAPPNPRLFAETPRRAGSALDEALANIEAAAKNAIKTQPTGAQRARGTGGGPLSAGNLRDAGKQ